MSKFAALHPLAMMYGMSIGATLGIALALSFAMNPHDVLAYRPISNQVIADARVAPPHISP